VEEGNIAFIEIGTSVNNNYMCMLSKPRPMGKLLLRSMGMFFKTFISLAYIDAITVTAFNTISTTVLEGRRRIFLTGKGVKAGERVA